MKTRVGAVSVHGGLLRVRVVLNGAVEAFLVADAGAARCVLSEQFSAEHPELHLKPTRRAISAGVAGHADLVPSPAFTLESVEVGAIKQTATEFVTMVLPPQAAIDGVLGVNFLRPFRVTFDFIEEWLEFDDRS